MVAALEDKRVTWKKQTEYAHCGLGNVLFINLIIRLLHLEIENAQLYCKALQQW
jgi:hypothetical protein